MAGDPAGLAGAYDEYAVPLYTYCRSLLSEPADAADAVHDTSLIAAARLRGLRDPDKLARAGQPHSGAAGRSPLR